MFGAVVAPEPDSARMLSARARTLASARSTCAALETRRRSAISRPISIARATTDSDRDAEFVVNNQSSFCDAKPAWCQPWTIVSTGTVAIATPGALFHDGGWLVNAATVVVALGVSAWWFLFLWVVPREYDAHRGGPSSDADDDARG